jgi:putative ABC transport system substrate-binding protein
VAPALGGPISIFSELASQIEATSGAGGLMSYGATTAEIYTSAAEQVAKILGGTPPSELPLREATRFELVINNRTAKALGLTIPPSLLVRADEVID